MTGAPPLCVERLDGGVERWTLDRAEARNPISDAEMVHAIVSAVDRVSADLDCGAVILTGAGSAFSAGGDVRAMQERRGLFGHSPAGQRNGYQRGIQRITRALVECDVPMVAAVNGAAIGAGCDLALMCDLRVASTQAVFAESFVRLGLIPGDGGAWLLPRIVGHARATELALTGRRIDAATAESWGMVSRVVEPAELLPTAEALAAEIAGLPREAVRMTKSLLRRSGDLGLNDTLELSAAMQPLCHATPDHQDLVDAFGTRRAK
jgi:enoyl-CoA hydratase/carnithine racemase